MTKYFLFLLSLSILYVGSSFAKPSKPPTEFEEKTDFKILTPRAFLALCTDATARTIGAKIDLPALRKAAGGNLPEGCAYSHAIYSYPGNTTNFSKGGPFTVATSPENKPLAQVKVFFDQSQEAMRAYFAPKAKESNCTQGPDLVSQDPKEIYSVYNCPNPKKKNSPDSVPKPAQKTPETVN